MVDCAEQGIAKKEFMFPFCTVVQCPQNEMLEKIGPTLVCTAITEDKKLPRALIDAVHIDPLNLGAMPTIKRNRVPPHGGRRVAVPFRGRAYQHDKRPPR